jgi:hypothetical protein
MILSLIHSSCCNGCSCAMLTLQLRIIDIKARLLVDDHYLGTYDAFK